MRRELASRPRLHEGDRYPYRGDGDRVAGLFPVITYEDNDSYMGYFAAIQVVGANGIVYRNTEDDTKGSFNGLKAPSRDRAKNAVRAFIANVETNWGIQNPNNDERVDNEAFDNEYANIWGTDENDFESRRHDAEEELGLISDFCDSLKPGKNTFKSDNLDYGIDVYMVSKDEAEKLFNDFNNGDGLEESRKPMKRNPLFESILDKKALREGEEGFVVLDAEEDDRFAGYFHNVVVAGANGRYIQTSDGNDGYNNITPLEELEPVSASAATRLARKTLMWFDADCDGDDSDAGWTTQMMDRFPEDEAAARLQDLKNAANEVLHGTELETSGGDGTIKVYFVHDISEVEDLINSVYEDMED